MVRVTRKQRGGFLSKLFGKKKNAAPQNVVEKPIDITEDTVKLVTEVVKKQEQSVKDKADIRLAESELVMKAAEHAVVYLPKILAIAGVAGASLAAATGIGVPVVVAGLIVVSVFLKYKGLNLKLRALLQEHQEKLFSILRIFLIIQKVIMNIKIPYTKFDKITKAPAGQEVTSLKISPEFQESVTEYMMIVKARIPPPPGSSWFKRAFSSTKRFFTAGSTIEMLVESFSKILDSFNLEIAKFNLIIPFNTTEFDIIKDKIKSSSQYSELIKGISKDKPSCGDASDPEAICKKTDAELAAEYEAILAELKSMVPMEDIAKATEINTLIDTGAADIQETTLTELVIETEKNKKEAEEVAKRKIFAAASEVEEEDNKMTVSPPPPLLPSPRASIPPPPPYPNRLSFNPQQIRKRPSLPPPPPIKNKEFRRQKRTRKYRRRL
jgi:hypothetical protein